MRLSGAKAFKDLFGDVRSIEVSIIIILFSISLTLITDGIEELIKNTFNIYFQIIAGLIGALLIFLLVKEGLKKLDQISIDVQTNSPKKTKF